MAVIVGHDCEMSDTQLRLRESIGNGNSRLGLKVQLNLRMHNRILPLVIREVKDRVYVVLRSTTNITLNARTAFRSYAAGISDH